MGAAMAHNLISAGMEVRAWNRTREKAEPLADDGAKVADTPAEAAEAAGFLLTMLSNGDAVAEAVDGEDGALSALPDDGVWLQMSPVGIEGHERLAKIAGKRGVFYVDAPVLGTKSPAEQVSLAEAVGVDPSQFLQVIEGGPLGLPYAQTKGQMMIEKEFPTSFSANLARKDASLVFDAARAGGLRLPISEAAATHFDETIDAGHGEEDVAAVYQATRPDRRQ